LRVKRNIFARRAGQVFADLPVVPIGRSRERQSALARQANQPAAAVWTVNRRHGRWQKTDPNAQTVYGLTPWFGANEICDVRDAFAVIRVAVGLKKYSDNPGLRSQSVLSCPPLIQSNSTSVAATAV
jgi:hypothetical protein